MKDNLHIIEISPHIYAGAVNTRASIDAPIMKTAKGYYTPSIPTGGIAFLFNKIHDFAGKGHMIFVSDRNPVIKKQIYTAYKENRSRSYNDPKREYYHRNIENQKEMAEEILQDCGFKVFFAEGYEADDILYSICEKYHKEFNHIFIHADDSDNFINVRPNVSILPCSSRGRIVSMENYTTAVDPNRVIPYSALTFLKFLNGDKSDNVDPLPENLRILLENLLWNDHYFPFMREKEPMRALIEHICPQALLQFDVIYPLTLDIDLDIIEEPIQSKIEAWGAAINCNRYRDKKVNMASIQPIIDKFFKEGRALE